MTTIPPEAFNFLQKLTKNNNRPWFNQRKPAFKALEVQMKSFFTDIADLLQKHDDIDTWRPYRIYRDIHFSKDKTPYKKYFAAEYNRRKPALRGGYYIRIQPANQSFLEAGFWGPNSHDLKRVRTEWASFGEDIQKILSDKKIKKTGAPSQAKRLKQHRLDLTGNIRLLI